VSVGVDSNLGTFPATGRFYRAQVLNGINGTTVLDINCDVLTSGGQNNFLASTGQTVTINRSTTNVKKTVAMPSKTLKKSDDANIYLSGVTLNYLNVPNSASLQITGDIDLRIKVALNDWTPSALNALIAKMPNNTSASGYGLCLQTDGTLMMAWGNGTASFNKASTVIVPAQDGDIKWVRSTLKVNNGASGNDVNFYTSDNGTTWTQLGSTVTTASVTSIATSTNILGIGSFTGGGTGLAGRYYRAQVLNGINGTTILDVDTSVANKSWILTEPGNFLATTGQTVTLSSTANSGGMKVNYDRYEAGRPIFLFGGSTYLEAFNDLQHKYLNFGQNDSFTVMVIIRQWPAYNSAGIVSKAGSFAANFPGYIMANSAGTNYAFIVNGQTGVSGPSTSLTTQGNITALFGVRNRNNKTWSIYKQNGVTTSNDTITDSIVETTTQRIFTIGAYNRSGGQNSFEFMGAAVWPRVLSTREINIIMNYYGATWQ
jgi:hypothetical protein